MVSARALRSHRRTALRAALGGLATAGILEATTELPSRGRSSPFYHSLADAWVVPGMRRFLDPETAHGTALALAWLAPVHRPSEKEDNLDVEVRLWGGSKGRENGGGGSNTSTSTSATETVFPNPIGLAAGYDKDGTAIGPLLAMGFGFVEVGSVCLRAQPGNPSPRMFRLVEDEAIINRYGFNSEGADAVEARLRDYRAERRNGKGRPWCFSVRETQTQTPPPAGPVGINLGKNKASDTPLEDYRKLILQLGPYADYLVVNVSCPNLSGLRALQSASSLEELLGGCLEARDQLAEKETPVRPLGGNENSGETPTPSHPPPPHRPPLLVKLSPDLTDEELENLASVLVRVGIDGIVVSNTTTTRPEGLLSPHRSQEGGLSGRPLGERSTECVRLLYAKTKGSIPIVGVGGVRNGRDAYEKLRAGASLVQVYTGMVYGGPGLVSRIRDEVAGLMLRNGQKSVQDDVVGIDHPELFAKRKKENGP
ncbi:unnamed protein product [Pseudo-nitzschia multistriata]|uniref:Dihydroorotate dehydrogenase (quinone), mitochondrial n=1 Tax=Pseudo-nitzschia multistriata TaxID=183589 RepID=A0A448Z927_9STRA|nr:unnamed protein product [Pseudo-nitzschia multistriata]